MALIGLDEEFNRRANTKQITGESGKPLADADGNILLTGSGPGEGERTIRVDHDVGSDGSLHIDVGETYGANVAHMFINSNNGDNMRVAQQVVDDSGSVEQEYIHNHTEGSSRIDTVMPILADSTRLEIAAHQMGDSPEMEGVVMFTSGDESARSFYNLEAIVHNHDSVGTDGTSTELTGVPISGVPHGYDVTLKAPSGNTNTVWVGYSDLQGSVDDSNGYPLSPGDEKDYAIRDPSNITAFFPDSSDVLVSTVESPFFG